MFFNLFLINSNIVQALDLITTTSGNTLDKTIILNYILFSTNVNNSIIIDYGDSYQQTINLNLNPSIYKN